MNACCRLIGKYVDAEVFIDVIMRSVFDKSGAQMSHIHQTSCVHVLRLCIEGCGDGDGDAHYLLPHLPKILVLLRNHEFAMSESSEVTSTRIPTFLISISIPISISISIPITAIPIVIIITMVLLVQVRKELLKLIEALVKTHVDVSRSIQFDLFWALLQLATLDTQSTLAPQVSWLLLLRS